VFLGLVEEEAGFDAGDDGFGPEVVEELGPGEDWCGFPGLATEVALGVVVELAEIAGGERAGQDRERAAGESVEEIFIFG